jgi:hypothetical protein
MIENMNTFGDTFKSVEKNINPRLLKLGFKLSNLDITETPGSMAVFASAHYLENRIGLFKKRNRKFIQLSTAPLRLELDLDFGWGDNSFSIYELYKLEGNCQFPERSHDLYEAMYESNQLQSEFERLIDIFEKCGKRFLSNDISLKNDLENQRINQSKIAANEKLFNQAEKAFKAHLWHEVVSLLEGKDTCLNKLNHKRLQYAKKMLHIVK